MYGNFCGNKFCIFYWFWAGNTRTQFIEGIPLTGWGCWYFFTFNYFCVMAIVSHVRASFMDPGVIPKGFKPPFMPTDYTAKQCEKGACTNTDTWKPTRAHHCSMCNRCIFKVSPLKLTLNVYRWTTTVRGSTIVWATET